MEGFPRNRTLPAPWEAAQFLCYKRRGKTLDYSSLPAPLKWAGKKGLSMQVRKRTNVQSPQQALTVISHAEAFLTFCLLLSASFVPASYSVSQLSLEENETWPVSRVTLLLFFPL